MPIMTRRASPHLGPFTSLSGRSSWPTLPGRRSPTRISARTRTKPGRRMCSRTTRPGGLQPTSPSCPSCYPTRPRNDLSPVPRDHRRRRAPELAGNAGERESAEPTVKHSEIPNRLYPRRCGREVIHCLLNYHHAKENFLLRVVAWLALFTIPPILGFPLT